MSHCISKFLCPNLFRKYAKNNVARVCAFPDHKAEAINHLIVLVLVGCVNEDDIEF